MGRSRFCLAPRGITPWTIHLFVAMLAGCIPVPELPELLKGLGTGPVDIIHLKMNDIYIYDMWIDVENCHQHNSDFSKQMLAQICHI